MPATSERQLSATQVSSDQTPLHLLFGRIKVRMVRLITQKLLVQPEKNLK